MPENLEVDEKVTTFAHVNETSRDGAEVARWAHNPKVVGSNPAPATKRGSPFGGSLIFYMLGIGMCADSSVVAYLRHAGCWGSRVPARSAVLAHRLRWQACAPIVWMRPARFRAIQVCAAVTHAAPFLGLYAALPRWGSFSPSAHTQTGRSQLLLQLSALCWGLSWRCLISPLLPRREQ